MFVSDRSPDHPADHPAAHPAACPAEHLPAMDLDELDRELRAVAAHVAAGTCRFLVLLAEFDRRNGAERWECRSTVHWLSWRCGISPTAAREQVRVARRLADMPLVTAAFAKGRISYSKVRAISRVCTGEMEQDLLDLADVSTAEQLERMCAALRRTVDRAAEDAEVHAAETAGHDRAYLRIGTTERGEVTGSFRLPVEAAEVFRRALDAAVAQLADPPEPDERAEHPDGGMRYLAPGAESCEHRRARALVAMAEHFLAHPDGSGRPRPELVVHVDLAALLVDRPTGLTPWPIRTSRGAHLSAHALARLVGDAGIRYVADLADGTRLDLGRHSRTVTPALFRALLERDRHCRFPGCATRHRLHAHHIVWWIHGGTTDRDNLILLCPKHHHAIHDRGWSCAGTAAEPVFTRPDGTPVTNAVDAAGPPHRPPVATAAHPAGDWQGDRIDWDCFYAAFHHHLSQQIAQVRAA